MIRRICDECKREITEKGVTLKGWQGRHGGVMLPEGLKEFDFCGAFCFESWVRAGMRKLPGIGAA